MKQTNDAHIKWLSELSNKDVAIAGGKGASLAEMFNLKMPVPSAFIITAQAFSYFIEEAGLKERISEILSNTDINNTAELEDNAKNIREMVENAGLPEDLQQEILESYEALSFDENSLKDATPNAAAILKYSREPVFVAVRSSATTEDLSSISKDDYVLVKANGKPVFGRIEDVYNKFNACSLEVPSMKDNKIVWAKVKQIYRHKAEDVKLYKIETEKGREITVSPDHSLIILDRNTLSPKTITIEELKNIDLVPAIANLPQINVNTDIEEIDVLDYISGDDIAINDNEVKIKNKSTNWQIQHGLKRRIPLKNDFAYFLGLFVAEGSTYKNNNIIITNSNDEIINKVKEFLSSIELPPAAKINRYSLRIYCKGLVRLLHSLTGNPLNKKGKGRSCYIKRVPNFIFGCKKEFIQNFLRGCFDGDGYIGHQISYTSVSKELICGIVKLLEILGIEFFIKNMKNYYKISIPLYEIKKFKEQIGFTETLKIKKLDKLIESYNKKKVHPKFKDNFFISETLSELLRKKLEDKLPKINIEIALCPYCSKKIEKTSYYKEKLRYYCKGCKKIFYKAQVIKTNSGSYVNYDSKGRFVKGSIPWNKQRLKQKRFTKLEFKNFLEKYNLKEFSELLNTNVNWDQVKKVEPINYSGFVYDFVVPGVENFAAGLGGIITHNTASFAGQQETFVNVKGNKMLIDAVKKCAASLFTARAIYYREKKGFKHESSLLAIVVQRMINSEKSGVVFSHDPMSQEDNIVIEAVFGLGEGIVSGMISPDHYALSRELKIIEKKISDKKIAITRNSQGRTEQVELTDERSAQQVLTEYELKKLAAYAIEIEEHYKKPQDIEFGVESGHIYILQSRPITTLGQKKEFEEIEGNLILSGIAASPGIASGIVKVIMDLSDLRKIKKGDVLVTEMTNPDMVVTMQKSAAIVTDSGGMTAHAAIVSREMGIPAVVGTKNATSLLKDGMIITVDGNTGKIYEGKTEAKKAEIKPIVQTKTKIKVIVDLPDFAERASRTGCKDVGLTRIEGIIASSGKHPYYFLKQGKIGDYEDIICNGISRIAKYFDEMWIRTSDIRSDEYKNLEGSPRNAEANPMLGMHGIRQGLKSLPILKAELSALKKVSDENENKKIGIMMPQVISVDEAKKVKEILSKIGANKNIKTGVMIETPAAVQIIEKLCQEGIDFISFGTNDLTQYTLAIDRGNEAVQYLYDEMHPAVLSQLAHVINVCKKYNVETSICGQAGSNKNMVEFLVKHGIDSISVNADAAHDISVFVKDLEDRGLRGSEAEKTETNAENQGVKEQEEQNKEEIKAGDEKHKEQEKPTEDNFTDVELGFDPFEVQSAKFEEASNGIMDEPDKTREEADKDIREDELDIF